MSFRASDSPESGAGARFQRPGLTPPEPEAAEPPPRAFSRERSIPGSEPVAPDQCENVLAAGARWKGTLTVESSVRVDGNFAGRLQSSGTVYIAKGAKVDARVQAGFVVVAGELKGEVVCGRRVDLLSGAHVTAEIVSKAISVEEGAVFDGHIQMTTDASSARRPSSLSEEPVEPEAASAASLEE